MVGNNTRKGHVLERAKFKRRAIRRKLPASKANWPGMLLLDAVVGGIDPASGQIRLFTYDETDAFSRANPHVQVTRFSCRSAGAVRNGMAWRSRRAAKRKPCEPATARHRHGSRSRLAFPPLRTMPDFR